MVHNVHNVARFLFLKLAKVHNVHEMTRTLYSKLNKVHNVHNMTRFFVLKGLNGAQCAQCN